MENKTKDQTIKVSISRGHNKIIEKWIEWIERKETDVRITKQKVLECAIEKLTEADAQELSSKHIDNKAVIMNYARRIKNIKDPSKVISLIREALTEENDSGPEAA